MLQWNGLGRCDYDDATLLAEYHDPSRSGEAGPIWLVPIVATVLMATWLIGGYKLTWRLCRWFR